VLGGFDLIGDPVGVEASLATGIVEEGVAMA
jgi:hypothetical protein